MSREATVTREIILRTAKKMFLEKGFMDTDMMDIARSLGCSRSTLYRHFSCKGDMLILLADDAVRIIRSSITIPQDFRFSNGYDAFCWQLNSLADALISHVDDVTFLRDFDCVCTKAYPETSNTQAFLDHVDHSTVNSPLQESFDKGLNDGSIRPVENPELYVMAVMHSIVAVAQRILPREKLYIEEYGYGQEILREHIKTLCRSAKNSDAKGNNKTPVS